MFRISRVFFWTLRLVPFAACLFLGALAAALPGGVGEPIALLFVFAFVVWFFIGGFVSMALVPLFVSKISCPGCHEEIDPVTIWACGCGYKDHRERHVLAFRCPKCGGRIGHFDCPRCSATILI